MYSKPLSSPSKTVANYTIIDLHKPLGKGSYGTVYRAYQTNNPKVESAVKTVPLYQLKNNKYFYEIFMREIHILEQVKGEHVVQLLDQKLTENNLYIFTEYCDGGTLNDYIKKHRTLPEKEACSIIKQIAKAFTDLERLDLVSKSGHKVTIMHRDIKPANILFHKGKVKVADFGFAKIINDTEKEAKHRHTICGTPMYESPQIMNEERYSAKCDIWSTGVMFYELLFGCLPWNGVSVIQLYNNIRTKPLKFPKPISFETEDLLIRMLAVREEDRINWSDVYNHLALQPKDSFIEKNIITTPMEKKHIFDNNILQRRNTPAYQHFVFPLNEVQNVLNNNVIGNNRDKSPIKQLINMVPKTRDRTPPRIFDKNQPIVKKEIFKLQEYNPNLPIEIKKREL